MMPKELKKWRKRNGYSQGQLASFLDVNVMTISRWERGVRSIPSFLDLALESIEKRGGELKAKGKKKKREVRK